MDFNTGGESVSPKSDERAFQFLSVTSRWLNVIHFNSNSPLRYWLGSQKRPHRDMRSGPQRLRVVPEGGRVEAHAGHPQDQPSCHLRQVVAAGEQVCSGQRRSPHLCLLLWVWERLVRRRESYCRVCAVNQVQMCFMHESSSCSSPAVWECCGGLSWPRWG